MLFWWKNRSDLIENCLKKKNKDEKNQLDTMLDEWSSSVFPVHC